MFPDTNSAHFNTSLFAQDFSSLTLGPITQKDLPLPIGNPATPATIASGGWPHIDLRRAWLERSVSPVSSTSTPPGTPATQIESLRGQILSLARDQHGCRFLQNKIEEGDQLAFKAVMEEIGGHIPQLMIDPFGNYLCQRLFEHANDEQRTLLVQAVAAELLNIAFDVHGTRAVQRMIETLTLSIQVRAVVNALSGNVVTLIKDLNGNHVIQKCLNRFSSEENQFIYDAVSENCVEVATHRHGCCVLQRCFDHASPKQKIQLVECVIGHALTLIQDAYGNYVVQYILDLGESVYSEPLIKKFVGNVCILSIQKFSSNAVEKCIRVSEPETRRLLIAELISPPKLERLLRDPYGNYVVQTALERADPCQREELIECVRPLLPAIRNTPYGKRIHSKLQREKREKISANGKGGRKLSLSPGMLGGGMEGPIGIGGLPTPDLEYARMADETSRLMGYAAVASEESRYWNQQRLLQQQQIRRLMNACYVAQSLGMVAQPNVMLNNSNVGGLESVLAGQRRAEYNAWNERVRFT
ncbi:uncharacterized protein VTP21DRAFT_9346 [Calcarisporiella thermophila]|uniref:uncharacterized protein n=1 Tax=Calcarisporiella thermophila TaxID=911321 RepID=UPI00374295CA